MAWKTIKSNGDTAHDVAEYVVDTVEDINSLPYYSGMGSLCIVVQTGEVYIKNSKNSWELIGDASTSTGNGNAESTVDLSNYPTKVELENSLKEIRETLAASEEQTAKMMPKELVDAFYRPIKYEISNLPNGAMVDYREKEIRIFCPEGTEFKKQTVGENGVANMYYMTFKAYAPEGAVAFKEGDRGVIVDTKFNFKDSAAGTDKYGRNYSVCWLALASYDESTDTWSYFGKTSNNDKYIGWTYIVEWYDANDKLINTDKIRINLANKDCYLTLAPYHG